MPPINSTLLSRYVPLLFSWFYVLVNNFQQSIFLGSAMIAVAARGRFTHPSDFQIAPGPACTPLESRQHLSATARQPRQLSQAVDGVVENSLSLFLGL